MKTTNDVFTPRALTPEYSIPPVIIGGWQLATGHALGQAVDYANAKKAFDLYIKYQRTWNWKNS